MQVRGTINRNPRSFDTVLDGTLDQRGLVPQENPAVANSEITTAEDAGRIRDNGIVGFLIGEAFMRRKTSPLLFEDFVATL